MVIGLDPVWLRIGSFALRPLGLLSLLGLAMGVWLMLRFLTCRQDRDAVLTACAWAIPMGVLSAHVVHVLGWWDYYLTHGGDIWQLGIDTLSLWGGLVGGGAIAWARLRHNPRRLQIMDAAAPGVALAIVVGRLGAFLEGAGQGVAANVPWATKYTSPLASTPDFGVSRHPAQLYDALICLVLLGVLLGLRTRLPPGGTVAVFVVSYAVARLALGAVRLDPPFLFGLQIEQVLALGAIAFVLGSSLRSLAARRSGVAASPRTARG